MFSENRNESHEVILKHSIVSGKREITMNGRPVHLSKKLNMSTDFDHPWDVPGHLMRVSIKETVDRFVYSLFIDNVPFRHLPHNSEVPAGSGSSSKTKKSSGKKSSSSSWDPFAEAGVDTKKKTSSSKKKNKKKKKNIAKQKSTSDWVDFGDDSSSSTEKKKKETAGDLLADVFSSSTNISSSKPTSSTSITGDLFSSVPTDTSVSLSDLSSLYASSGTTTTTTATTPASTNRQQHAAVKKTDSWGGLVDLNGITAQQSPAVPTASNNTSIAMDAFNTYNMQKVATTYMSPSQPSNGMMMGGRGYTPSPGMLPPRSMQFQNTTPTQNPHAMSNHRRQAAAKQSAASAFEADPFARFN